MVALVAISLLAGALIGRFLTSVSPSGEVTNLQSQVSNLQNQLNLLSENITRIEATPTVSPANIAEYNKTLENLRLTMVQIQNQLLTIQQQISSQPTPNSLGQNVTVLQLEIDGLQSTLATIQEQIVRLQTTSTPSVTYQNVTYVTGESVSLNQLFEQVKTSVVVVQGLIRQVDFFGRSYYNQVQGSGFVYNYSGRMVVLTNNHVVSGAINITTTFTDGAVSSMTLLGSNPNTDFAVLNPTTSISRYKALEIISSSTVKVGDPVIVVGTPYGLAGSMSNGIVSALNRTLTTSTNTEISNLIQTTAPLNPGNSGGPVMNYYGQVVGIATAIVQESQGIGFAIPSDTILSELQRMLTP